MAARPRRLLKILLAAALVLTGGALSACGEDDKSKLLSRSKASELRSTLAQVEESAASGDCTTATQRATTLREQVDSLPTRVERDLRLELARGVERLQSLIATRCESKVQETPAPAPTPQEQQPTDESGQDEGTDDQGKDQGKGKDKGLPPGQENKTPDENSGDGSGGTPVTPDEGGDSGGVLP